MATQKDTAISNREKFAMQTIMIILCSCIMNSLNVELLMHPLTLFPRFMDIPLLCCKMNKVNKIFAESKRSICGILEESDICKNNLF